MKQTKAQLWNKDFTLVVIGQIISLFGNAVLRFVVLVYKSGHKKLNDL